MAFGYDSTLAAFMRQMGVNEQDIYAESRERADMAKRQYERSLPMWAEETRTAVKGVDDDAQARGVYASGNRLRDSAYAQYGVALRQNEALAMSQDQQTSYALDAARRIADLRRQAAEQELAARSAAAVKSAASTYGS